MQCLTNPKEFFCNRVSRRMQHASASASASRPGTAAAAENGVIEIHSLDEWRSKWQAQSNSNKLMVVHFSAKWCGPCRFIEPAFAELAAQFKDVAFVTIDVDELEHLASKWKVRAIPTFFLLKGRQVMHKIVGAKRNELERKIQMVINQSTAA
nr:unnamed protein product [Ananas comosus var. bracteatus]